VTSDEQVARISVLLSVFLFPRAEHVPKFLQDTGVVSGHAFRRAISEELIVRL
jgi:hypothetical protein